MVIEHKDQDFDSLFEFMEKSDDDMVTFLNIENNLKDLKSLAKQLIDFM